MEIETINRKYLLLYFWGNYTHSHINYMKQKITYFQIIIKKKKVNEKKKIFLGLCY